MPGAARPGDGDELRPVTALFADLVGSTRLGERLSPDEVKALVGECVTRMSEAVEEFGGTVQAYQGDGIAAYFGVPVAHEDDPERAARAALRILDAVERYRRDVESAWGIPDLSVRVGLNSGQTAVGLVGAADRQQVALGNATNVAARLSALAEPGTTLVGPATARQLAGRFDLDPVDPVTVRGRAEPVQPSRLVRARVAAARPFRPVILGRDVELAKIGVALDDVVAGRSSIVVLTGEAGIGKTRLLAELRERAADRGAWLGGHCRAYGSLAYGPYAEALSAWLGLQEGEPEIASRTKLQARLGPLLGPDGAASVAALGRLVGAMPPAPAGLPADEDIPHAVLAWLSAFAARQPVVLAIDDGHWADPDTVELTRAVLGGTDRIPLLVVWAMRAEPSSHGWAVRTCALAEHAHRTTELRLGPLDAAAADQLLGLLLPGALDAQRRAEVVERGGGNPLYLEEVQRAVVEQGAPARRRTWTVTIDTSTLPPALENLLIARIDRLSPGARRVAQVAAAVGRTFPVGVVAQVLGGAIDDRDIAELYRAEIVHVVRRRPELVCAFTHRLLQEAAVSTLTAGRRAELNGRIAAAFEAAYGDAAEEHLEELAHYHAQSSMPASAVGFLERAGDRALRLDAPAHAAELWSRGLRLATRVGDQAGGERLRTRLGQGSTPA